MRSLAPGLAIGAAFAAFATVFVAVFVSAERCLYFFDQVGVWSRLALLERALRADGVAAVAASVVRSVRNDEYNLLAPALLLPATGVLGLSRLGYVLSIVLTFALPALALLIALALALRAELGAPSRALACFAAAAAFALTPQVWVPVLVGQPDVGCVAIAFAILLAVLPPLATARPIRAVVTGVLLALLVLLRRWTVFWCAGFVAGLVARSLVEARASSDAGRARSPTRAATWIAACCAVGALVLVIAAGPVLARIAGTDVVLAFSAYRVEGGIRGSFGALRDHLGLFLPALAATGAALALRDRRARGFAALIVVQLVVSLVLFLRVQDLDVHHFYLLLPGLIVLAVVAMMRMAAALVRPVARWAVVLGAVAGLALGFAAMVVPPAASLVVFAPLVPSRHGQPLRRGDLAEVERLLRALDALTAGDGGGSVYVLSSSVVLNDDVLRWAWLSQPGWPELGDRLVATRHVDLRDGFPGALRSARWVVVSDPVGYHLRPGDQRVVGIPAQQILSGIGIGRFFQGRPEEFALDGGTRVRIFERVSDIPLEALNELAAEISAGHPGHESLFTPDPGDRKEGQ